MTNYSASSLRTRRGWCTRKGHLWPTAWLEVDLYGRTFHEQCCERCTKLRHQESDILTWITTMTFKIRSKKLAENVLDKNPILEMLQRRGAIKCLG